MADPTESVSLPAGLVAEVEALVGRASRDAFIREAVEERLQWEREVRLIRQLREGQRIE